MDRRKALATVGAISLTASAAVVALGSNMGLFGLTETSSRVGRLSPIDSAQPARTETNVIYVDDPVPAAASGSTAGTGTSSGDGTSSKGERSRGGGDQVAPTSSTPGASPTTATATAGSDDDHSTSDDPTGTGSTTPGHDEDD
ncbi:MAG: hypothetical protein ACXVL8_20165 [Acidimicrobiia bacterium]